MSTLSSRPFPQAIVIALLAVAPVVCRSPSAPANRPPLVYDLSVTEPAYPDRPVVANYKIRDPDGDPVTATERRWHINNVSMASHNDRDSLPAGVAQPGDEVSISIRATDGKDWGEPKRAEVLVSQVLYSTLRIPVLNYLNLAPVAGLSVSLVRGSTVESANTDSGGIATIRYDTRETSPPTLRIADGAWYAFERPQNLFAQNDTVWLIGRFVDPNGVDRLQYLKYETVTDQTGFTKLATWKKRTLKVFLDRAQEFTPGFNESVWQGFETWNAAIKQVLNVQRFTETAAETDAEIIVRHVGTDPTCNVDFEYTPGIDYRTKAFIYLSCLAGLPGPSSTRIVMHEAGHAQGLIEHYPVPGYVMSGSASYPAAIPTVERDAAIGLIVLPHRQDMAWYSQVSSGAARVVHR